MQALDRNPALLVIDVQMGFEDPAWGPRNNPAAEANVAVLLDLWRWAGAPIIHVHHDSPAPIGRMRRGSPGNAPKPEAAPRGNEPVYRKSVNSAFIGADLEFGLRGAGVTMVVLVGLTTNHCVSTTARMAGNLGFKTLVVADATVAFDRANVDGSLRLAEDVHRAALSDLHGEFVEVVDTPALIAAVEFLVWANTSFGAERV